MKNIRLLFLALSLLLAASACQDIPDVGANIPTVTTLAAEPVGSTTATIHGKVSDLHATHCEILLLFSTDRNFPDDKTSVPSYEYTNPGSEISINADLTELLPGTTYYYQCCATDGIAEVKGEVKSFTTNNKPQNQVITGDVNVLNNSNAVLNGFLFQDEDYFSLPIESYFLVSFDSDLTDARKIIIEKADAQRIVDRYFYSINVDNLILGKNYYYAFYIVENDTPIKGETRSFIVQDNYEVGNTYYENGILQGIIFKVNADGKHGLIVSLDEAILPWSIEEIDTGTNDLYNGANNMNTIKKFENWESRYPAINWCASYPQSQEKHEWYLPAALELKDLYIAFNGRNLPVNLTARKSFNDILTNLDGGVPLKFDSSDMPYYWCSNDVTLPKSALMMEFSTGNWGGDDNKLVASYIRAIRKF